MRGSSEIGWFSCSMGGRGQLVQSTETSLSVGLPSLYAGSSWERSPTPYLPDLHIMSKILIINGAKRFLLSKGALNHKFAQVAAAHLTQLGHSVSTTVVDDGYEVEQEIMKIAQSDYVIYQMPAWWMGAPWTVKKYLDEVFTAGHGVLYASDGRSRYQPEKKYGSGGLLYGKKYMLSLTWNAPLEAFNDPVQFFEGVGVEGVYLPFHKANQFLGLQPVPTFIANDVEKNPQIEADLARFTAHLTAQFGSALGA